METFTAYSPLVVFAPCRTAGGLEQNSYAACKIPSVRHKKLVARPVKLSCSTRPHARQQAAETSSATINRRDSLFLGVGGAVTTLPLSAQAKELGPEVYESLAIAKKIDKLMAKREWAQLEELVSDDCLVRKLGPVDLPYSGRYTGKTAVADFYQKFDLYFKIEKIPEKQFYLGEANAVFVAHDYEYTVASNFNVTLNTSACMKMVITDGKLTKLTIISDTLAEYLTLMKAGGLVLTA